MVHASLEFVAELQSSNCVVLAVYMASARHIFCGVPQKISEGHRARLGWVEGACVSPSRESIRTYPFSLKFALDRTSLKHLPSTLQFTSVDRARVHVWAF